MIMVLSGELIDALLAMNKSFMAMYDDGNADPPGGWESLASLQEHHLSWVLALDPTAISEEYSRMYKAAEALDGNTDSPDVYGTARAQITLAGTHLQAWTGIAADAYKAQLSLMLDFCTDQKTRMLEGIRGLAAAYGAEVEARANLLAVYTTFKQVADAVVAGQQAQVEELKWTILADVVQGALTMNPRAMVASLANTAIDVVKDGTPLALDDGGRDSVVNAYIRKAREVCYDFRDACEGIERHFRTQEDSTSSANVGMFEPLPVYCDVTGPNFSYEYFKDSVHNPGPIGPEVSAERTKYAEEQSKVNDPNIDKRLNPGPGGKGPI
jgi:hypothetical protein